MNIGRTIKKAKNKKNMFPSRNTRWVVMICIIIFIVGFGAGSMLTRYPNGVVGSGRITEIRLHS